MSVAQKTGFRDDLTQMQVESVKTIALFIGATGFVWYLWVGHPAATGPALASSWIGVGTLILSAILSYMLVDRSLYAAAHLLIWGITGGIACGLLAFRFPGLVYLFVVPIIFSSVLLSQRAFLLVCGVVVSLILAMGATLLRIPAPSVDMSLPILTALLVTFASWLARRSLYTALSWVWDGYERARHNEEIARQRASELRRALKALDEATHRLERLSYMHARARDQAEEARRLKQQFAQTISHELRAPLNLIVGFTELMAHSPEYYGGELPPAYLRDLGIVYRNACHLQNLVSDVLDLARIEAAQMSLVPEEADPAALVNSAVDTVRSLVEARGLTLHTEIEPDLPALWVDPVRVRQVLFNLLNNAARFTDRGGVDVSVRQQGGDVIFAVADTGMGIAPEHIDRIFEEFEQADGSMRRRHGGAGLGLAISKRFVDLHKGRMWVESQVGQGSTFYFSLPVERADLIAAPACRSSEETTVRPLSLTGGEEPVLLVVTHSPAAAALMTRYVSGFRTVVFPDLKQAREAARRLMPQAVVIDQTCEELAPSELQGLGQAWGLPCVPFVACPLPGESLLRQQLAVDGYLVKPVSRQSLWDILRQFGEDIDRVMVVDDDRDFVRMLGRMLDSPVRRYQVIGAYSGREALAMMGHRQPDLVLLDLMMPDVDGFEVIERMHSNPVWRDIPIVVVSAQDEAGDYEVLGGVVMVTKATGLVPGEVITWVRNLVGTAGESPPVPSVRRAVPVL